MGINDSGLSKSELISTLKNNLIFFKSLTDSLPILVSYFDSNQKYKFVNQAYCDWFGIDPDERKEKDMRTVLKEKDYDRIKDHIRKVLSGQNVNFETTICNKDGKMCDFKANYIPVFDENNKVNGFFSFIEDVTDRKKGKEKIKELNELIKQTTESMIYTDKDFKIKYINKAGEKLFGYSLEELKGKTPNIFNAEPLSEKLQKEIYETVSSGKEYTATFINKRKDGSTFYCNFKTSPIYNEKKEIIGYVGVQRDITEKKKAKENLKESNRLLSKAKEVTGLGILKWNLETNDMEWSDEVYKMYQVKPPKKSLDLFKLTMNLVHPDDIKFAQKNIDMAIKGSKKLDIEHRQLLHDGKIIWVHAKADIIRDKKGKPNFLIGTIIDITEKKEAEEKIKESEEKFRNIFEKSADGIIVADIQTKKFVDVNDAIINYLGYSKEEILKKSVFDIHPKKDLPYVLDKFKLQSQGKILLADNIPILRKDKKIVYADINSIIISINNKPYLMGVFRDITEKKKTEEKIKASEEKFRNLVSNVPGLVYRVKADKDWSMVFFNEEIEKITGYPTSDFKDNKIRTFASLIHPNDVKMVEEIVFEKIDKKEPYSLQYRIIHKDGCVKWLYEEGQGIFKNGKIKFLEGVCIDVTEKKKAEEKLLTIIKKSPIPTAVGGKDGSIISFNEALVNLIGYKQSEIKNIGVWAEKLYPDKKYRDFVEKNIQQSLRGEKQDCTQFEVTCKGGSKKIINFYTSFFEEGLIIQMNDVTEKKKTEERLEEEEEKFASAFKQSHGPMAISTVKEGRFVEANDKLHNLLEYTKDEFVGQTADELEIYADSKDRDKIIKDLNTKGRVENIELKLRTKTGKIKLALFSTKIIKLRGKKYLLSAAQDITEKREAEEKYKKLFETSIDAIMTLNPPNWLFTSGNPATIKMFKCKNEKDFTSRTPFELSPEYQPDGKLSKEKALEMVNIAMEKGSNFFQWVHKRTDGEEFPVTVLLTKVELEKGKPFLQATVRDVTELRKSEEKYRNLIENANDGIVITQKGKLELVNKSLIKLTGYTNEEILSKSFLDFIHEEDKKNVYEHHMKRLKGQKAPSLYEFRILDKKGNIKWVRNSVTLIQYEGKPAALSFLSDITKEKELERQKEVLMQRIENYAKKLEIKLKRLEKDRLRLTNNEKLVLYGMTANPYATDDVLADKLKLKRPTVTAIRNRMYDKELYTVKNYPNFEALGFKLLSIINSKFKKSKSNIPDFLDKEIKNKITYMVGNENNMGMMILSRDIGQFHEIQEKIMSQVYKIDIKTQPPIYHLPFGVNKALNVFEFGNVLKKRFKIDIEFKPLGNKFVKLNRKLKKNEKNILYALIKYPEAKVEELSEITGLTKPTIINIKKRLFKLGYIQKRILPNFKKLGFELMILNYLKYNPDITNYAREKIESLAKDYIFFISGKTKALTVGYFKTQEEYNEFKKKIPQAAILGESTIKIPLKSMILNKSHFAEITKEQLDINVDY